MPPDFLNSPFFVMEPDNWHLLPGAPEEVVKEFEEFMKETDVTIRADDFPQDDESL